jgi:PiT family inorganic phosphate transporter
MDVVFVAVFATIALAVLFDFTNGFHDSANSTSTVIATRSLSPRVAVLVAAVFNFLPVFIVGTAVANTITKTVNLDTLPSVAEGAVPFGVRVTLAALIGAIFWNSFTWHRGLPSSSSHALIGGLVGAGLSAAGMNAVNWEIMRDIVIAIFASPLVAFTIAIAAVLVIRLIQRIFKLDEDHVIFQVGQIASSCWVSWGHGSNDAQKTMGVVAATLFAGGYLHAVDAQHLEPPIWVIFGAHAAIALGTLYGGWSIISTLGFKINSVTRASGLGANIGAIVAIEGATNVGIPISTTQAVSSSIVGSGVGVRRLVHWRILVDMAIAWTLKMPAAAIVGFVVFKLTALTDPFSFIATGLAIAALIVYAIYLMRNAVSEKDIEAELPTEASLAVAGD